MLPANWKLRWHRQDIDIIFYFFDKACRAGWALGWALGNQTSNAAKPRTVRCDSMSQGGDNVAAPAREAGPCLREAAAGVEELVGHHLPRVL